MTKKDSSFVEIGFEQIITETAFPLAAERNGIYYSSGTATVIGPGLAVTAKHVIQDFFDQYENIKRFDSNSSERTGTFSINALNFLNEGKHGIIWAVNKVYYSMLSDIAILYFGQGRNVPPDYRWKFMKMDLTEPKIGEKIAAFGYHSTELKLVEENQVNWKITPATSTGQIVEIFPERRDNSRLNFPCFQTNARFDGGMSGGPVVNEAGKLCGIICSNLPPMESEEEHTSYVSLLWPSMLTKIDLPFDGLIPPYPALSLAENKIIDADGWKNIDICPNSFNGEWYTKITMQKP